MMVISNLALKKCLGTMTYGRHQIDLCCQQSQQLFKKALWDITGYERISASQLRPLTRRNHQDPKCENFCLN